MNDIYPRSHEELCNGPMGSIPASSDTEGSEGELMKRNKKKVQKTNLKKEDKNVVLPNCPHLDIDLLKATREIRFFMLGHVKAAKPKYLQYFKYMYVCP